MVAVKSLVDNLIGGVSDMGNTALQNRGARDVARINEADDVITSGFNQEVLQQLQQALSKVDKQTLEKVTGQTISDEQMKAFQTQVGTATTTGNEKTTQTVTRGSDSQQKALDALVGNLATPRNGSADFTAAMNQVLRSGMPAMANVNNNAGAFDSTTSALLQQDLAIKAAEAGLSAQNAVQTQQNNLLLEALKLGQSGTESVAGNLQREQQEQSKQSNTSSQSNQSTQNTTQNRQGSETGTTSTVNNTTSVGSTTNQQYQDVVKDTSKAPTTGPIADLLAGRPIMPPVVGTPGNVVNPPVINNPDPGTVPGVGINDPSNGNDPYNKGLPLPAPASSTAIALPNTVNPIAIALANMTGRSPVPQVEMPVVERDPIA